MDKAIVTLRTLAFLLVLASGTAIAGDDDNRHFTLQNTHFVPLSSIQTGRDYELVVALPGSYDTSPDQRYPVLYILDPWWHLPLVNAVHGSQVYDRALPELIIVGISYPGVNPDFDDLRSRDYTPTRETNGNPNSGDAGKFLAFIEESVIPLVDSTYRTQPDERALSGVSLGGLFTLWAMYQRPELFNRYIALSPAVLWDDNLMFRVDDEFAADQEALPARLFIAYGTAETPTFAGPIIEFQQKIANRHYQGLALLNHEVEGERHGSACIEGYSRGMRWVFKDLAPTGPSGLERQMNIP
jgi:predicted alpha/beta superfamily hydrolase